MVQYKEDTMSRLMRVIATMFALVLVAAACSSDSASKAGGEEPPIVLKIGTNDFPGRVAADQIEEFAARVDELSAGGVRVEPVWRVGGTNTPNWDQLVARQVVSGELEMGNIPSRAFDTVGVTSLRALNAPFLITTDELLDEVVTNDLADDMLSGLDEIGLVGLAILPEGLRYPFGFNESLLGPDDYEGGIIRAPASATTAAAFEALGATVTDNEIDPGSQIGMESAYVFDPLGTAAGNVVLFPKANVLVVNVDVFARLSESQQEILEQAASETLDWSVESRISDAAAAEEWCAGGGRMVAADGEVLEALADAVEPVYQQLRTDQLTAELIDQIEEIKTSMTVSEPVFPDGCIGEPAENEAAAEGTDDPSVINGSYRFEWDADELADAFLAVGATPAQVDEIGTFENAGVISLIFSDGNFEDIYETGFYAGDHCDGTYTISGNRITMVASSDPAEYQCANEELGRTVVDATWELTDRGLLLSNFVLSEEPGVTWFNAVFFSKPLTRVD
jgi:TRAP-type C4-dicarboxylate transport system substrate-binding protein